MTDREACIALNMISGIGYTKYTALSTRFGNPSQVPEQDEKTLREVPGIGETLAQKIAAFDWAGELTRELSICDKAGVRVLTLWDEAYPEVLRNLYDPPLCLYVRGILPEFPDNALAVVGTRRMSSYAESMTRAIASDAVNAGYTVVSGLAKGVDTIAHWAAVDNGGKTVAVLGGGLAHLHPAENLELARKIVETGGAVISEFPLMFPVSRTGFPRRNRIVAGLCCATLVMEAGLESGALITARLALENGRDVFALPGRVDNPQAKGCHKLIKEGASLMEDFTDVLNVLNVGLLPVFRDDPGENAPEYRPESLKDLSPEAQKVLALLDEYVELPLEKLSSLSGIDPGTLLSVLMRLELKLMIEQGADQLYRRTIRK